MFLKKIIIKNFRVFDKSGIEVVFNKGINALIGENNSGKSSIIDAIRIAFSAVAYKKDIFFTKADFHVNDDGSIADFAQFDIYLEDVPNYLIEIWDLESKTKGEFHVQFTSYIAANGVEKIKSHCWGTKVEGNPITADTLEAIDIAYLGALRDSENEMRPSRNSRLAQLIKNIVPEEDKRNELVSFLRKANADILKKEQLIKTRDTVNSNLSRIEKEILQQQIDIGLVEPRFESIAASIRAWVKPKWVLIPTSDTLIENAKQLDADNPGCPFIHETNKGVYIDPSILTSDIVVSEELKQKIIEISSHTFELYQNGLGYNNLLYMSAVLGDMSIKKNGVYGNLMLIEEPEAHLHPQLQELVHSFLCETKDNNNDIQVIFTSHSPTLVSRVGLDNVNLLYDVNHSKYCLPLSETNLDDNDKLYLEKYLDVTKSQMFYAKGILFVEGISEALIIPELAKLMGRNLDKYAVETVNLSSVAFKPFVDLFTSTAAIKCFNKIAIITDDDRCTDKTSGYYISKDLDYCDLDENVLNKLDKGTPSNRFIEISDLCQGTSVNIFGAKKTLEYAICFCESNIAIILEAILEVFPEAGKTLTHKVNSLKTLDEKAACIWLFIRNRDSSKGAIAQRLCKILQKQYEEEAKGIAVKNKFLVPEYIKNAILLVTKK